MDKSRESAHNIVGIGIDRELTGPGRNGAAGRLAIVDFPIGEFRYIWKVKRREFPDQDIFTLPVSLFVALAGVLKAAL